MTTIELLAVVSCAFYGIILGCRKRMDVVGIFSMAFAVSFGGGTLRDLFLDRHPLFWIANDHYAIIVLALAIIGTFIPKLILKLEPFLPIPDALGLALFTVTGVGFGLEAGTSSFIAVILGVVTGTFGGVIADVLSNEVPSLFKSAPLYAICSFIGSWLYLGLLMFGAPDPVAPIGGIILIFCLRIAAIKFDLRLPNAPIEEETCSRQ